MAKRFMLMANMAPETSYQGSKNMKRVDGKVKVRMHNVAGAGTMMKVERSSADRKADKGMKEGSTRDRKADAAEARRTIAGKSRKHRCAYK